jgi:hypothetical protein
MFVRRPLLTADALHARLQDALYAAAVAGDAKTVERCLRKGVAVDCRDSVRGPAFGSNWDTLVYCNMISRPNPSSSKAQPTDHLLPYGITFKEPTAAPSSQLGGVPLHGSAVSQWWLDYVLKCGLVGGGATCLCWGRQAL